MARLNLIEGVKELVAGLKQRKAKAAAEHRTAAVVGYTADYAIYVHENLLARHEPGKQAKFLEQPFRENKRKIPQIIRDTYRATGRVSDGLLRAALLIQRESQLIVPVSGWDDVISPRHPGSGNLRASAFTRLEKG